MTATRRQRRKLLIGSGTQIKKITNTKSELQQTERQLQLRTRALTFPISSTPCFRARLYFSLFSCLTLSPEHLIIPLDGAIPNLFGDNSRSGYNFDLFQFLFI